MKHSPSKTGTMLYIAVFAAFTAIGAFIRIPIGDIPITTQSIFPILAGLTLGKRNGVISQLVYMLLGIIGLPVFSSGSGIGYLLRPSFGYILGFVTCAYVSGFLIQKHRPITSALFGSLCIYIIAIPYSYIIMKYCFKLDINIMAFITSGMLVFLPLDVLKALLASALLKHANSFMAKNQFPKRK